MEKQEKGLIWYGLRWIFFITVIMIVLSAYLRTLYLREILSASFDYNQIYFLYICDLMLLFHAFILSVVNFVFAISHLRRYKEKLLPILVMIVSVYIYIHFLFIVLKSLAEIIG